MTFSASSMEAWWRWVGFGFVLLSAGGEEEEGLWRRVSRRQFARPAVEVSFLDQMIWTPPVDLDREAIWPLVIV